MIRKILCIFLFVGCTETITEVKIKEVPVIEDSDALSQIYDSFWADFILSVDAQGDSIYQFVTVRTFSFEGKEIISVSAVRGIIVWDGSGNLIGTSLGSVYKSGTDIRVFELVPEEGYVHIVAFEKDFLVTGAYFSNYYAGINGVLRTISFGLAEKKSVEKELDKPGILRERRMR